MQVKHVLVESMSFPELWGGVACLDFANTLDGRATERPEENLHTYADLVSWVQYAGLIDPATAARLSDKGATLRTALDLREAIFQIFTAVGRHEPVPEAALAALQTHYAEAMAHARLAPEGGE